MKNGLERKNDADPGKPTNVVSLANARKRAAKEAAKRPSTADRDDGGSRISLGQWIIGALFMLMAIGGAVALVSPLVKGAGIAGGWGNG